MVEAAYAPLGRARKTSATEFLDSPGRKYPRLFLLALAVSLFLLISWLPHLTEKDRGPVAFVWPENQTRSARQLVRPDTVTTLLQPAAACSSNSCGPAAYLLVVVCSAVENVEARQAVRDSWARDVDRLAGVRVVFLLGQLANVSKQVTMSHYTSMAGWRKLFYLPG